jgi:hypothetical protein
MHYVALLAVLALTACASKNDYIAPTREAGPVSSIKGYHERNGLADWVHAYIQMVDNKDVSYLFKDETDSEVLITPGAHRLVAYTAFNRGFSSPCPCETQAELELTAKADTAYRLRIERDGLKVKHWIEEVSTGSAATPVVTTDYRAQRAETPIFIPIITN